MKIFYVCSWGGCGSKIEELDLQSYNINHDKKIKLEERLLIYLIMQKIEKYINEDYSYLLKYLISKIDKNKFIEII